MVSFEKMVDQMKAEADQDTTGTVTLRWRREQIAAVKRAAALMGVPDQTYLKHVVFESDEAVLAHQPQEARSQQQRPMLLGPDGEKIDRLRWIQEILGEMRQSLKRIAGPARSRRGIS